MRLNEEKKKRKKNMQHQARLLSVSGTDAGIDMEGCLW